MITMKKKLGKIVNMADAAAARREARRKRILENSFNRLQLISGKSVEDCSKDSLIKLATVERYSEESLITDDNASQLSAFNNGVIVTEPEPHGLFASVPGQDFVAAGDNEISNDFPTFVSSASSAPPDKPTVWEIFIASKYDIILLSLFIQILYSLSFLTFESTYFFLPLIIYTLTKLLWTKPQNNSNFANAILLLNGIPADRAHNIMNIVSFFGTISQDISLYLFTTICVQVLSSVLKDYLIM